MIQLISGATLIAFEAVLGFYGTQLAREGWASVFAPQAPSVSKTGPPQRIITELLDGLRACNLTLSKTGNSDGTPNNEALNLLNSQCVTVADIIRRDHPLVASHIPLDAWIESYNELVALNVQFQKQRNDPTLPPVTAIQLNQVLNNLRAAAQATMKALCAQ